MNKYYSVVLFTQIHKLKIAFDVADIAKICGCTEAFVLNVISKNVNYTVSMYSKQISTLVRKVKKNSKYEFDDSEKQLLNNALKSLGTSALSIAQINNNKVFLNSFLSWYI